MMERKNPMIKYKYLKFALLVGLLIALPFLATRVTAGPEKQIKYEIKANNGILIRKLTGEATVFVNGVPAEPVDSFVWDGNGVLPIEGTVKLEIDPVSNSGKIEARWTDENGDWTYKQTTYAPPHHATGLRIGPSASSTELITDNPVTTNVYLHGDTMAGGPVLPTVFSYLATWGPAEVTLNGQPFQNPLDGPTPLWIGHTMTTVGVRNEDGQVLDIDGNIYNPMSAGNGLVDNDDIEFHIVFHDAPGPGSTSNFPPPHAFFYHLAFEDVKLEIKHSNN